MKRFLGGLLGLTVLVALFSFPGTLFAQGEDFSYADSEHIVASGGDLRESSTFTRRSQDSTTYEGVFHVSWETNGFMWFSGDTVECYLSARIHTNAQDATRGVIELYDPGPELGQSGGETQCNTDHQEERDLEEQFDGRSITIDDTDYEEVETSIQRMITGNSYAQDYQSPPPTDTIELYGSNNDTPIDTLTVSLDSENRYRSFSFNDVDSGNYRICSEAANACKEVTKEYGELLSGVAIGEGRAYDEEGLVRVILEFEMINPQSPEAAPSKKFDLLSDNEVIQSFETDPIEYQRPPNAGSATIRTTFTLRERFTDVEPGTYQVCDEDRILCETVVKEEHSLAEVTLNYNSEDTTRIFDLGNLNNDNGNSVHCESKGSIAWVFCPVIEMMASVTDFVANNILAPFLQVDPLTTEGGENTVYTAWGNLRTVANMLLIPVFLLLIFAQATSFGMDAYSVKKALPRLVLAVIGIQLSYFVAAILIDVFNILGAGIGDLILQAVNTTGNGATIEVTGSLTQVFTAGGLTGLFVGATAIWAYASGFAAWIVGIALMVLLPLVLGVILTFFTLVLRQGLILLLVIFAPVAFVAWVLPNTEKWFKQWLELFGKTLLMYPLIMILIAGGKLLASLMTAGMSDIPDDQQTVYVFRLFAAIIALGAPLVLVPVTFKFAGTAMAAVGGMMSNVRHRGASGIQGDARDPNSLKGSNMRRQRQNRGRSARGDRMRFQGGSTEATKRSRLPGRRGKEVSTMRSKLNRGANQTASRFMDVEGAVARDVEEAQQRVQSYAETGQEEALFAAAMMGNGNLSKAELADRISKVGKDGNKYANDDRILASARRISSDPYMKQAAQQHVATKAQSPEQLETLRTAINQDSSLSPTEREQSWSRIGESLSGSNLAVKYTDVSGQLDHAGFAQHASSLTPQQMSLQNEGFWKSMGDAHATLGSNDQHMKLIIDKLKREQADAAAQYQARTGKQPSPQQLYGRGPAGSARAQQAYGEFMKQVGP